MEKTKKEKVSRSLWWYRKACDTAHFPLLDSYAAYWNCVEILCSVSGSKIHSGSDVDLIVQEFLSKRKKIKAGHIQELYNQYIRYSIASQIKDELQVALGSKQAERWIYYCFEILPEEERLYNIRNDINHGNIRENSALHYERVFLRGMLLSNLVMKLLHFNLGFGISASSQNCCDL